MYEPCYQMNYQMLPILSRLQIDDMAEKFLEDFQPEALREPMEVDVEGFLEFYLGITPDYQYLSHNMIYLGMAVFHDTNSIPIYDPSTNRAEYFSAKAKTAIFDRRLVENKKHEHRFRFTCGHESGHFICHTLYFERIRKIRKMLGMDTDNFIQCYRTDGVNKNNGRLQTDGDWIEWQANQFSSSLLMPKTAIFEILNDYGVSRSGIFNAIREMESTFNVSNEAIINRLKNLGLINTNSNTTKSVVLV